MNLPPLLLGASLVFWGWQADLLAVGVALAVAFEGTRLSRFRWESTQDELNRLWNLVTVIFLAAAVFAFTSNDGMDAFGAMFENPGLYTSRVAGESSQKTAAALVQWMPMIFFLFLMAVTLSRQSSVKLKVLSLIARRQKPGQPVPPLANREVHVGWLYLAMCLVSASIQSGDNGTYFAGLACLTTWALWSRRNRRYVLPLWACTAGAACLLAYWGQGRIGELRVLIENFTPQWSWRAGGRRTNPDQDQTGIGHIGVLKGSGRIVVRVNPGEDSRVPTLLRTASYREFRTPNNWAARARADRAGSFVSYDAVYSESRPVDWQLRQAIGDQQIHIATYLEGGKDVLPLPLGVTRLENLGVFTLKTNGLGVVFADGPGVVVFDAFFASRGSLDSDPAGEADLDIPARERAAVEAVVAEMDLAGKDLQHQLRTVSAFFQDKFEYSLWQGFQAQREATPTPLARFLIDQRRGHCEYFATATVLILRKLGIPARYAVGWAVQEASGDGYVVRERHAHAWCIYYNRADKQWHELDTTPASWIKEEDARASMLEFLSDFWQRIKFEFAKWRWGQTNIRDYVWWIIGPMLVFLLYRLLRRKPGDRARLKSAHDDRAPARFGLDSEFFRVEKKLGELGFIRSPGETQARFVERAVRDVRVVALRDAMFAMLQAHYRLRFDPKGLTPEEREALILRAREVVARLGKSQVST